MNEMLNGMSGVCTLVKMCKTPSDVSYSQAVEWIQNTIEKQVWSSFTLFSYFVYNC